MQVNRLFEIIYILLNKNQVTAKEMADYFEVSTRTIYRDIDTLSSAGIPIYMTKGKGGGISLLPNFVLNKAVLTDEEKKEILSSMKAVNSVNLSEDGGVLNKITSLFGESKEDWIEVDFSSWGNAEYEKRIFNDLKEAILNKNLVQFQYSSGKRESIDRIVEPLKLCFKGASWYLYGYCKVRDDFRFFKLRRIKNMETLNDKFQRKSPSKIFSNENEYEGELVKLKLKLSKEVAYRVYDEFEKFEVLEDKGFIAEIDYPKGEWIFQYITSFGQYCEIIEPLWVKEEMKERLKNMLEKYL
ncbi:MAG: YafY family protein [Clostridium sp.]|nr:YafY family protein [Clostridium sp.]